METHNETNPQNVLEKQNLFDGIAATCAVGGAIAAAATQSVALAAFPLAGAIGLHMFNRRQLLAAVTDHYETMIRQQNLYIVNHQNTLNTISERLQGLDSELTGRIDRLSLETTEHAERIAGLRETTDTLENSLSESRAEHRQLAEVVEHLQQIENTSHALQSEPESAEIYCQRGLNFGQLGDKKGAIADFTRAIQLDPHRAEAYHQRGLLKAELGDRKAAVDDLREAAKFYFELGDIDNYQKTKDLALELYDNDAAEAPAKDDEPNFSSNVPELISVGGLFDD
jgi:tetratricopeptide (TPR) repeat protein